MSALNPIPLFTTWNGQELQATDLPIPSACCLSTIGLDGFPNARMVSLKEVSGGRFIITCPLHSRKAQEVGQNHKVALTFWWPQTERQVRVQGTATRISDAILFSNYSKGADTWVNGTVRRSSACSLSHQSTFEKIPRYEALHFFIASAYSYSDPSSGISAH